MSKKKGGNSFTIYPYYRHTGQDPMVSVVLRTVGRVSNTSQSASAKKAKVSPGTVKNWQDKKTRRPQHATLAAYAGAHGLEFRLGRKRG